MKKIGIRCAALAAGFFTLAAAAPALARPVCINDGSQNFYFSKLKLPKKPGQTTAMQGVVLGGLGPRLAIGGASMLPGGSIRFSLFVHSYGGMDSDFTMTWTGTDGGLVGVGYADTDGDYVRDDDNLSVTTVDCSSLMYP